MLKKLLKAGLIGMLVGIQSITAYAALPTATSLVEKMGMAYNIGNTMEVPSDPTLWGNTVPTKQLIDSIKAAGFNTVRIPTAWYTHSDASTNTINTTWLNTVKTVVDYCIANDLYVIVNSHWDKGWLEDNVFSGKHPVSGATVDTSVIRQRQFDYWTQIAETFKSYDEHLLFAGANEPGVNDPRASGPEYTDNGQYAFNEDRMKILQQFHQAFIDAVRGTGDNNATRTLIVQAPRTEIDKAALLKASMPTDPAGAGYIMAEVHFYPYQFSLMKEKELWWTDNNGVDHYGYPFYYWGDEIHPTDTIYNSSSFGPEFVDDVFGDMKKMFTDNGIPVVVGEFGAIKRLTALKGDNLARHLRSRAEFYGYVAKSARTNGLIPVIWDTGAEDDFNMTVIRRQGKESELGQIFDYEVLNAMRKAYGLDTLAGNSIDSYVKQSMDTSNKVLSLRYDYTVEDTTYSAIRFSPATKNLSDYTGISIDMYVSGTTVEVGGDYGFYSMDLAVMTGSGWDWTDTHFAELVYDSWETYTFEFTDDKTTEDQVLQLTDSKAVNAFSIQTYLNGFTGTVQFDNIVLLKADGTADTVENFNKKVPVTEGAIVSAQLVTMGEIPDAVTFSNESMESGLKVYPNPVEDVMTIEAEKEGALYLYDVNEKALFELSIENDMSMVKPGTYYVVQKNGDEIIGVERIYVTEKK